MLRAEKLIRTIPDFPKAGIMFKDITPVLADHSALTEIVDRMADIAAPLGVEVVAGIESRGFLLGTPLALRLGVGFVPIRKPGKLPFRTIREEYALEYGTNAVEIHEDAVGVDQRVLVVDDLLATGGTASAAVRLVDRLGGRVCGLMFMVELEFLSGRSALGDLQVNSLITF